MRLWIILISLGLLAFAGAGFSQQVGPGDGFDANSAFREQQRHLNSRLIDYAEQQFKILGKLRDFVGKEMYGPSSDYLPEIPRVRQMDRGDDDFNYSRARLDNLKLETMDAELMKNALKVKILDYNKHIPQWWYEAEAEFNERMRQVVQSGLRR